MKIRWLLGGLAAAAALAARLRGRSAPQAPRPLPGPDERAEELRRKLAESRPLIEEREAFESAELTVDRAEPLGEDAAARRREVHEQGRAALDEIRKSSEPG
ncbi:MAG: hypothetical protein H0V40_03695 [Actinobacteria bacterium]|nr:hypothetical protein [Actinomycetota bacterium]